MVLLGVRTLEMERESMCKGEKCFKVFFGYQSMPLVT